jgi:hypothetical protein
MKTLARGAMSSLGVAILLWCPSPASAQTASTFVPPEPRVGERLTVTYFTNPSGPLAYNYLKTVHVDFLMFDGGRLVGQLRSRPFAIGTESIRTVRRRIGTKPTSAPAMVLGSAGGFAAGFLIGAVAYSPDRSRASNPSGASSAVNRGLSTGVLVGAPLGALMAWVASRSRPIYEEIQIGGSRPAVAVSLSGRTRLSVTIPTR